MQRRRYLAVVGAALVAGCGGGGDEATATETEAETDTQSETAEPTQTGTGTPTATPEPSLQVRVSYPDNWSGTIQVNAEGSMENRSISDRGEEVYDLNPEASVVSVDVKKEDNSLRTITVEILRNGEVIAEDSTSEEFGTAEVRMTFD